MAALVPRVKIEAKSRHLRIISGAARATQRQRSNENVIETEQAITKVKLRPRP
jgi:hypothetical protein